MISIPTGGVHRPDLGPPGDPDPPLLPSPLQDLLRPPQPLLPRRLHRQDLDLPLLLPAQPLPSPLLQPPRRALPPIHHHRIFPPNPAASHDPVSLPPVFLFVLDTCMIEEEMGFIRSALQRAIGLLPEKALVGFVSFGTQVQVQVHEIGFTDMSKV